MKTCKVLFLGLLALSLTACQLFKPKDKPIDSSKEMPKVSDVVKSIQAAIDQSSGHEAWLSSSPFTQAKLDCKTKKTGQKQKAGAECTKERALTTKECNGYSGVHATVLCAEALHRAQAKCDAYRIKTKFLVTNDQGVSSSNEHLYLPMTVELLAAATARLKQRHEEEQQRQAEASAIRAIFDDLPLVPGVKALVSYIRQDDTLRHVVPRLCRPPTSISTSLGNATPQSDRPVAIPWNP